MYNFLSSNQNFGIAVVQSTIDAHGGISTRTKAKCLCPPKRYVSSCHPSRKESSHVVGYSPRSKRPSSPWATPGST